MNKKLGWVIALGLGLTLAALLWMRPGVFKVLLAFSALTILGLSAGVLIVSGIAWVRGHRSRLPYSPAAVAQAWHVPVGIAVGAIVTCLAGSLFVVYQANQPVVSCSSVPRKPSSTPPAALVTAADYFAQGDYEYEQSKCDEAIADYTRAIELNPNLAEAYNNRAYVYMVKKDYASALTDLDGAIQLRPDYVNALLNRGDIYNYYYSINYERAVANYDRVLQIDPDAANHTSVCGHRMLALQHGWNLNVLGDLLDNGATAGCKGSTR